MKGIPYAPRADMASSQPSGRPPIMIPPPAAAGELQRQVNVLQQRLEGAERQLFDRSEALAAVVKGANALLNGDTEDELEQALKSFGLREK